MSNDVTNPGKLPVRVVVALLAVILGGTALYFGLSGSSDSEAAAKLPSDAVRQGDIAIYGAYVREPTSDVAAAYFTMTNLGDSDDTITVVSSPASTSASLHDIGKEPLSSDSAPNMGSMVPSPNVVLAAGQTITLQPTAGHMMLEGVTATLAAGSTVNLILVFENAGSITVKAPVIGLTDPAPTAGSGS